MPPRPLATTYMAAPGKKAWGAATSNKFTQAGWPPNARREGASWKELWGAAQALNPWRNTDRDTSVLVRMDNGAASACASYSAGRSLDVTAVARDMGESEVSILCTLAISATRWPTNCRVLSFR